MESLGSSPAFVGYAAAYAIAAVGCGVALRRARRIEDPGTRRGLVALLAGSGGWALWEFGFLLAPTPGTRYAAYLVSLVVGLTTVGAWLYFCSAYTGRSFHRDPIYRRVAAGAYLLIVAVKLTNPLHGLYFTTEFVTTPFPHTTVQHETLHWVVSGLSYALVAVGFFMLYELFLEADYDTRPLGAVAAVTGLPVALDVVGFASDRLIDINYEPLGVAVFAVGALYVLEEQFLAVQLTDGVEDPVVHLDDEGRIRAVSERARRTFPSLAGATGERLASVLPEATDDGPGSTVLERDGENGARYYLVSDTSFSLGQTDVGRMVVFSDVTETERRRRELDRQNEQLEGFAAAIRHELLNTLQVVEGRVALAGEALDRGDVDGARESLRTASRTSDRMARIVDDLATLARHGQTLEDPDTVEFGRAVEDAWDAAETDGVALSVDGDGAAEADPGRLRNALESAFTFAAHNGASTVRVEFHDGGFAVAGDGEPLDDAAPEDLFEYGTARPESSAGMTLPNLRMLARSHGWEATVDGEYDDGVRIVVTGVDVEPDRVRAR
ncbi:MAG: histidine kinase N-terminal 7TM domain-containing protein [Haloarculaceae archaeon]